MHIANIIILVIINSIIIYFFTIQYFDHPVSFKLEPIYKATKDCLIESNCPRVIYQIVPDINNVPSGLYHTIMYNKYLNPEFEYRIYDYASALEELIKNFDKKEVRAFNSSHLHQIKTDYIKLAFIYKYGGYFIDIKNILCCKLIDLLAINSVYYIHNLSNHTMDLSLLASHPNNKGIKNAFEVATQQLITHDYTIDHLEITSGRLLGNELFYLGYLTTFSLLVLDKNRTVKFREFENEKDVLKIYKSFDKENNTYYLLPDIKLDWQERLIY